MNPEVTTFLNQLNHPLRDEIEVLREAILKAESSLSENIKWNGPNYSMGAEDRITMKIQPPKKIQLIFHRGAKKLEQPKEKLINDDSGILQWKENDRAIATFENMEVVKNQLAVLHEIVTKWIAST